MLFELNLIAAPATTPPPLAVASLIDGDAIDPGAKSGLAAKGWKSAEDAEEYFLRQVEGFVAVGEEVESQLVDHTFVAGHQFGAGPLFTRGAALYQRRFG